MMRKILPLLFIILPVYLFPQPVSAHAFGTTYTLPIPFWLYSYAGIGVLVVSFLIIGFFFNDQNAPKTFPTLNLSRYTLTRVLTSSLAITIYKIISVFLFLLTIVTGLFGEDLSAFNFNMTFFWVIFVLGFTYLTFLLGNMWEVVNPWKIIISLFTKKQLKRIPPFKYPERFNYYPAFLIYLAFICLELFIGSTPFSLSVLLIQYTCLTFFAVYLFGSETWFRYGEFFSVFFRFVSYTSLLTEKKGNVLLRIPFTGLIEERATDFSMLLFILFMLSSTAFDGFRETNAWQLFYWRVLHGPFSAVFGEAGYQIGTVLLLLLSPFLFLALYIAVITIMKKIIRTKLSIRELALAFAFSLIPIAFVYNVAHYFTLLIIQGQEIIRLVSDPFGWNWNLFGTATFSANSGLLSASTIWHTQVVAILLGHVIAVFIAHLMAVKLFPHKAALWSQLPMLFLMVLYTVIGLWILSQPLSVG